MEGEKQEQEVNQENIMDMWAEALKEQEQALVEEEKAETQEQPVYQTQDISKEIQRLLDIPLKIEVIIGSTVLPLGNLIQLGPGSVIELDRGIEDPVDILVNGKLIAKGEMVIVGDKFGVRITEIIGKEERIKSLSS